jgi:putative ATP-binding cassette transporter
MNGAAEHSAQAHFFRDFLRLAGGYWRDGTGRWRARVMLAALAVLAAAHVALAIRLNLWSADLFDALERRSMDRFITQIGIFALIIGATVLAGAADIVVKRRLALAWRRWLTARVLGDWMAEARHFQVAQIGGPTDNPDGRIAEDIRIATEYALDLAQSLIYAALLLTAFVGILWTLSGRVDVFGVDVPGHMVALAMLYAAAGSAVAFLLGRPLVRATDLRQTREADFRFGLVRVRETGEPLALARGEARERGHLAGLFAAIGPAWGAQTQGLSRLMAFSSGYLTLAPVFPILVATPRYIAGTLSLGGLMQTAQAFQQVAAALSWPVDNLAKIAEWRASVERVLALEDGVRIVATEAARTGPDTIVFDRAEQAGLGARSLCVAAPDGTALLSDIDLSVARGERVLVEGDAEAAQALFRVLAGIWPWGRGVVLLPADDSLLAVGDRPYLPAGTLAAALAFPQEAADHGRDAMVAALAEVGLSYLAPRLDDTADWDRDLGITEVQRLAFARIVLQRPRWVLLGATTGALEPEDAGAMLRLLDRVVPEAGVLLVGHHPGDVEAFDRRLTLQRAPGGQVLLQQVAARRRAAAMPRRRPLPVVDWLRRGYGHGHGRR